LDPEKAGKAYFRAKENSKQMEATQNKSALLDWLLFLVSTAVMIALLLYADEWFWLAMPFSFTYLAKALRVI
jgi:hypothetical protein